MGEPLTGLWRFRALEWASITLIPSICHWLKWMLHAVLQREPAEWWRSQVLLGSDSTLHQHRCDCKSGVCLSHTLWYALTASVCGRFMFWVLDLNWLQRCLQLGESINPGRSSVTQLQPQQQRQRGLLAASHCVWCSAALAGDSTAGRHLLSGAHARFNSPHHQAAATGVKGYSDICWRVIVLKSVPSWTFSMSSGGDLSINLWQLAALY